LDIRHKLELLSLLKQLIREKQLAVVISLHELDLAQKISDQVVCIANGKVDRLGTPEEIFSGSYIQQLYGVTVGSYNGLYGSLELSSPSGAPEIFIIGGGGAGMAVYRKLQRAGIPFAVGVLHENDVEWPAAQALAAQVVAEKAFEPISATAVQTAMALMAKCCKVICCVEQFGTMNRGNQQLLERAQAEGWLIEA
jgi:iron complex transport system ATP-binding protein